MKNQPWIIIFFILLFVVGCVQATEEIPVAAPATHTQPPPAGLTGTQVAALSSLTLVDDYPLYVMHYSGPYLPGSLGYLPDSPRQVTQGLDLCPAWGCSLFAALGQPGGSLTGRNFDWRYSPALLLFTDSPEGYASVSMVDMDYLGYSDPQAAGSLLDLAVERRRPLLDAPLLPFDGMNEKGLSVGMAAVPPGDMSPDPAKPTVNSLAIIRLVLDNAATLDEALVIFGQYNVDMESGPPIHYLVADAGGQAAVIEYAHGDLRVFKNQQPWHVATNFLLAEPEPCERYEHMMAALTHSAGQLDSSAALAILKNVSQGGGYPTQWSVVYELDALRVNVAMGRDYQNIYTFDLIP